MPKTQEIHSSNGQDPLALVKLTQSSFKLDQYRPRGLLFLAPLYDTLELLVLEALGFRPSRAARRSERGRCKRR